MAQVLDDPDTTSQPATASSNRDAGSKLQNATTAIRLHIRWPGVRKALSAPQKESAARVFNAEVDLLTATKKLLDTSHPAFRAVSAVRSKTIAAWRDQTLPYVEPGVRLVRRHSVPKLESDLQGFQNELAIAVEQLGAVYAEMVESAETRLGELFEPTDYPSTLSDLFGISWDYPSTTPPDYLRNVAPEIYAAECERIRERFGEAVAIAEATFAEELSHLVSHLAERLSGETDGRPKIFRDTAISNIQEFLAKFERLSIGSDESLERLVGEARNLVAGIAPEDVRNRADLRQRIAGGMMRIEASLDGLLVDRPRRNLIRRSAP